MGDLVLKTRMDSLQTHLRKLETFLDSFRKQKQEFEKLRRILAEARESVQSSWEVLDEIVHKSISQLKMKKQQYALEELPKAEDEIKKLREPVDKLLENGESILDSMGRLSSQIAKGVGQQVDRILRNRAVECNNKLSKIEHLLRHPPDTKEAWQAYTEILRSETLPLFAEYVEFVGGLALRDAGFDAGICQVADELIESYMTSSGARADLVTIPVHQQAVTATWERIIHLDFPEWTIWALPFTAFEFWHVVGCKHEKVRQGIQEKIPAVVTSAESQVYLADAFATNAMGPAYACSAILLRFNPFSPPERDHEKDKDEKDKTDKECFPADAKRALYVFAMLRCMNDRDAAKPWTTLIDMLEQEWNAALEQVNPVRVKTEDTFKEQAERMVAILDGTLRNWTRIDYPTLAWASINGWADKLLKDKVSEISLQGTEELRYVLNAAWLARLQDPAKTEAIAEGAHQLRKRIIEEEKRKEVRGDVKWIRPGV